MGAWAGVGGRHEIESQCGIAHFVEHLFFKGTRKQTAKELSFSVEAIGGYLNAYTTEDHTCYYAKAASRHFEQLSTVLLEMYVGSTFPRQEVEREREVIAEEILSYKDSPSQWVEEMLSACLWPRHPLGRSLTGTKESISKLSRTDLLNFRRRNYTGGEYHFHRFRAPAACGCFGCCCTDPGTYPQGDSEPGSGCGPAKSEGD